MSQQHRIAAHKSWAKTPDRTARTAPGRAAFQAKFEHQVDPDGVMSPKDRAKAAENARRAFYLEINAKSNAGRKRNGAATE